MQAQAQAMAVAVEVDADEGEAVDGQEVVEAARASAIAWAETLLHDKVARVAYATATFSEVDFDGSGSVDVTEALAAVQRIADEMRLPLPKHEKVPRAPPASHFPLRPLTSPFPRSALPPLHTVSSSQRAALPSSRSQVQQLLARCDSSADGQLQANEFLSFFKVILESAVKHSVDHGSGRDARAEEQEEAAGQAAIARLEAEAAHAQAEAATAQAAALVEEMERRIGQSEAQKAEAEAARTAAVAEAAVAQAEALEARATALEAEAASVRDRAEIGELKAAVAAMEEQVVGMERRLAEKEQENGQLPADLEEEAAGAFAAAEEAREEEAEAAAAAVAATAAAEATTSLVAAAAEGGAAAGGNAQQQEGAAAERARLAAEVAAHAVALESVTEAARTQRSLDRQRMQQLASLARASVADEAQRLVAGGEAAYGDVTALALATRAAERERRRLSGDNATDSTEAAPGASSAGKAASEAAASEASFTLAGDRAPSVDPDALIRRLASLGSLESTASLGGASAEEGVPSPGAAPAEGEKAEGTATPRWLRSAVDSCFGTPASSVPCTPHDAATEPGRARSKAWQVHQAVLPEGVFDMSPTSAAAAAAVFAAASAADDADLEGDGATAAAPYTSSPVRKLVRPPAASIRSVRSDLLEADAEVDAKPPPAEPPAAQEAEAGSLVRRDRLSSSDEEARGEESRSQGDPSEAMSPSKKKREKAKAAAARKKAAAAAGDSAAEGAGSASALTAAGASNDELRRAKREMRSLEAALEAQQAAFREAVAAAEADKEAALAEAAELRKEMGRSSEAAVEIDPEDADAGARSTAAGAPSAASASAGRRMRQLQAENEQLTAQVQNLILEKLAIEKKRDAVPSGSPFGGGGIFGKNKQLSASSLGGTPGKGKGVGPERSWP